MVSENKPVYNPVTKKMEFPKAEAKAKGERVARTHTLVAISKVTLAALAGLAREDGADPVEASTEQGLGAQNTRLATPYIVAAIADLLAYRESHRQPAKSGK